MVPMHKYLIRVCFLLALPSLASADFSGKEPFLCAIRDVIDCGSDYPCTEVVPETVALPDFLQVDLASKKITGVGSTKADHSPIERIERLNGKLILQGGDAAGDNPRGGVGWTLAIAEDTGRLVMSGVGDGFAIVVFGSCLQP